MLRKVLLCIVGLVLCITASLQAQSDSIRVVKVFGGYKFESNNITLSYVDMQAMMKNDAEACQYLDKAKSSAFIANIFGMAGGALIGFPIGTALGGGKPNWVLAGVGCGLIIIAIPIISSSNKNALIAVNKYNSTRKPLSYKKTYDLKLGLNPGGLALVLKF